MKLFSRAATTQNLVVKFDSEVCGGVLVENASDNFPQQKKLENLLPNFTGSSPPISPKTSPTSFWKLLVLIFRDWEKGVITKGVSSLLESLKTPESNLYLDLTTLWELFSISSISTCLELRWPGDSQRKSGRFARTDSRESILCTLSEDRGCLEEGCLGLPGVFPDIS